MEGNKDLKAKLKECDIDVKNYISDLKNEIKRLHRKNIKLTAKNDSQEIEIKELKKSQPKVVIAPNEIEKPPTAGTGH